MVILFEHWSSKLRSRKSLLSVTDYQLEHAIAQLNKLT